MSPSGATERVMDGAEAALAFAERLQDRLDAARRARDAARRARDAARREVWRYVALGAALLGLVAVLGCALRAVDADREARAWEATIRRDLRAVGTIVPLVQEVAPWIDLAPLRKALWRARRGRIDFVAAAPDENR